MKGLKMISSSEMLNSQEEATRNKNKGSGTPECSMAQAGVPAK
jgi:hypothetical protein